VKKFILIITACITAASLLGCQMDTEDLPDIDASAGNTSTETNENDAVPGDTDPQDTAAAEEPETAPIAEPEIPVVSPEDIYGTWKKLDTGMFTIEFLRDNTVVLDSYTYTLEHVASSESGEWQAFNLRDESVEETGDEYYEDPSIAYELDLSLTETGAVVLTLEAIFGDDDLDGRYFHTDKAEFIIIDENNWQQYYEIRMESEPHYDPVWGDLESIFTGWQFGLKPEYMTSIADCNIEGETLARNEGMFLTEYNLETNEFTLTEYTAEEIAEMGYTGRLSTEDVYNTINVSDYRTTDFKVAATWGYINGDKPLWTSEDGTLAYCEHFINKEIELIAISGILVLIK